MAEIINKITIVEEKPILGNFKPLTDEQMELIYAKMEYEIFHGILNADFKPTIKERFKHAINSLLNPMYSDNLPHKNTRDLRDYTNIFPYGFFLPPLVPFYQIYSITWALRRKIQIDYGIIAKQCFKYAVIFPIVILIVFSLASLIVSHSIIIDSFKLTTFIIIIVYDIIFSIYFAISTWLFWSFFSLFYRK